MNYKVDNTIKHVQSSSFMQSSSFIDIDTIIS